MAAVRCPICEKGDLKTVTDTYVTEYLGRDGVSRPLYVPNVTWSECGACGEAILDDDAVHAIEAARRHAQGLLSPKDIKVLRTKLDKTQTEMSNLLGVGEKTYCRWESGAYIQSTAFDKYLRLLIEVPENVRVLECLESGEPSLTTEDEPPFTYLDDPDSLQARADAFTFQLERGQLYFAASTG